MANYEATKYDFDGANLTGIEGIPTATIIPWSDTTIPSGFLECNGVAVSRATYADLFAIVGTTYGSGNGSTTFNTPDLQDNISVGVSNNKALASTGGNNTTSSTGNVGGSTANASLSEAQLASHDHARGKATQFRRAIVGKYSAFGNTGAAGGGGGHAHNMSATFSGDATSIIQPYLTMVYIIKT